MDKITWKVEKVNNSIEYISNRMFRMYLVVNGKKESKWYIQHYLNEKTYTTQCSAGYKRYKDLSLAKYTLINMYYKDFALKVLQSKNEQLYI